MEVDEEVCLLWLLLKKKKRKRRYWVHPILRDRLVHGQFVTLYPKLRMYDNKFFDYLRMSIKSFDELIELIRQDISCSETHLRPSVSPEEKLVITLRYLGTGCSFGELSYNYRLGKSTITGIVREVCKSLWNKLVNIVMPEATEDIWKTIARDFERYANFPNCIGAIDGKHIRVIKPVDSGSLYHNYKHYFSIVLLALCDANYCFTYVDIGAYGKSSDSAIFKNSVFYKRLTEKSLNIPTPKPISNVDLTPMPYVIVGDEAFGLAENLLRPYSGKCLPYEKRIFNYRLSRARRNIECTFGILANKWRIFHRPINVNIDFAEDIIKASCVLHNYVRTRDGLKFKDTLYNAPMTNLNTLHAGRGTPSSLNIRDKFAHYFVNDGRVPWQDTKI
ncbi:protein ALP1-like [Pararge aegeria]|uniref:protein ALP1-like n=1 Tax=Pararge aegeria TaxID=116150 RepID=UPI0019D14565|nr:protein ALP1-like [Pararge aegeria]